MDVLSLVAYSAAILAGGHATRFGGRDKGALVVDGRPIRERQLEALSSVADDVLIVGGSRPMDIAESVRHVGDRVRDCGPLGGLYTALSETDTDATLVVACDMPYLSVPLLQHLLALAGDADAVVPRTERGYHPLCAAYARACLGPIARHLAERRLKVADLFDEIRVRVVDASALAAFGEPGRLLANVNTADEYKAIEANKT
jgi:molybdenum cofactor guanylyltransferase